MLEGINEFRLFVHGLLMRMKKHKGGNRTRKETRRPLTMMVEERQKCRNGNSSPMMPLS